MTDESVAFVYCLCDGEITDKYQEDDEDIKAMLISKEEAKNILENEESIDIIFGKKEPCTWGRFEISADGKEWKTIDLKQKDARLTAGLQKAPVKFVRFTNAGSDEQQVYLRQFVLSIEKK